MAAPWEMNTITEWTESQLASFIRKSIARNYDFPAGLALSDLSVENLTVSGVFNTEAASGTLDTPSGSVIMFAGSIAPTGYLLCDGSAYSRTTYAGLYAVIGTTYGAGDGSTTFNIPDCRERVVRGDSAALTLGATSAGTIPSHAHNGPSHTHDIGVDGTHNHGGGTGQIMTWANGGVGLASGSNWYFDVLGHSHTINYDGNHAHGGATASAGTGATSSFGTGSDNIPKHIVMNYIIKT